MAAVEYVNSPRGAVQALTYVWDVGLLAWVEGTQAGGGGGSAPSGTIGAAAPATASPMASKNASGNLAYPLLDGSDHLYVNIATAGDGPYPVSAAEIVGNSIGGFALPIGVQDNTGKLAYPNLDASGNLLVAVTGAGSGGTSSVDGAAYVASTTAGTPLMIARDDAAPGTLAEDKVGIARGSALREVYTQIRDAAGNDRGVNISAANALKVDGSAVTQPISAASLPLPTGASTAANQTSVIDTDPTGGTFLRVGGFDKNSAVDWFALPLSADGDGIITKQQSGGIDNVSIYDGVNAVAIKAASVAPLATDPALVVALSPNGNQAKASLQTQPGVDIGDVTINNAAGAAAVNVQDGGNSLTIDGSVTVTQATGTNLHAVLDSGTLSTITNVVHVDDNAGSLTVDNSTLSVVGGGTEATALRVTVASDSTGVITVKQATAANLKVDLSGTGANATAIKVDGSAVTQPISAVSLPLPTGAATSGNQTTEIASLATIVTQTAPLITTQGATSASVTGPMVQALVSDSRESYQDTTIRPMSLTTDGRLRVSSTPGDVYIDFFGDFVGTFTGDSFGASPNPYELDSPWS